MGVPIYNFKELHNEELRTEAKRRISEIIDKNAFVEGEYNVLFEKEFAQMQQAKHCLLVANGTDAIEIALQAYDIGHGDKVGIPTISFFATAEAVITQGATPVFIDVDAETGLMDPASLKRVLKEHKLKAIIPVHIYGMPAPIEELEAICRPLNIKIVEDSAQGQGGYLKKGPIGSSNNLTTFSFYPTKNMTTGEGGIITTNSEVIANKLRKIISHGSEKRYYHGFVGYNYRMSDVAAAIGIEQLKKLPEFNHRRIQNAEFLNNHLSEISGIIVPKIDAGHVFHQYTIRVTPSSRISRDKLVDILSEKGIASSVFYPLPIHKQEAYPEYNHLSFPITEKLSKEVLSLPIHPSLTETDLLKIVLAIKEVIIK